VDLSVLEYGVAWIAKLTEISEELAASIFREAKEK
jgi:hypothetical protein